MYLFMVMELPCSATLERQRCGKHFLKHYFQQGIRFIDGNRSIGYIIRIINNEYGLEQQ